MRKMKRLITLLMTVVMMMAMSITAFAAQETTTPTSKITINKLEAGASVNAYKMATINFTDNTIGFEDWVLDEEGNPVYAPESGNITLKPATVSKIEKAFKATTFDSAHYTATADENGVAELTVAPGLYYIKAIGTTAVYNVTVVNATDVDRNGNYIKKDVPIDAKGTPNVVSKDADDKFVDASQTVTFTLTATIPNNVAEYKVFDETTNLSEPTNVTVKVNNQTITSVPMTAVSNKYVWDFTEIVADHYGEDIEITYKANVVGSNGYKNVTYDSTPGSEETPVIGNTAKITLTKTDEDGEAITASSATFTVKRTRTVDGQNVEENLKFVGKDGVYELSTAADAKPEISTNNGTVTITGLQEGSYHFTETVAPSEYSINPAGVDVTVTEDDLEEDVKEATENHPYTNVYSEDDRVIAYGVSLKDSKLVQLPFTGGMGTTIFTILGVAIMAMAAALFFATKKNHN